MKKSTISFILIALFVSFLSYSDEKTMNSKDPSDSVLIGLNGASVEEQQTTDSSGLSKPQETRGYLSNFLQKFQREKYSLAEYPGAIINFNMEFVSVGQIIDEETYKIYSHRDSKLHSWDSIKKMYEREHDSIEGFEDFLFSRSHYYSLEEIPNVIARLNRKSSKAKKIKDIVTYEKFRYKDPRLPSWILIVKEYVDENSVIEGLVHSIFRKPKLYSLETVPGVVARLNTKSPRTEQITSIRTYKKFYYKDPRLPSWTTLIRWYTKIHGNNDGLMDFLFSKLCAKVFSAS